MNQTLVTQSSKQQHFLFFSGWWLALSSRMWELWISHHPSMRDFNLGECLAHTLRTFWECATLRLFYRSCSPFGMENTHIHYEESLGSPLWWDWGNDWTWKCFFSCSVLHADISAFPCPVLLLCFVFICLFFPPAHVYETKTKHLPPPPPTTKLFMDMFLL